MKLFLHKQADEVQEFFNGVIARARVRVAKSEPLGRTGDTTYRATKSTIKPKT